MSHLLRFITAAWILPLMLPALICLPGCSWFRDSGDHGQGQGESNGGEDGQPGSAPFEAPPANETERILRELSKAKAKVAALEAGLAAEREIAEARRRAVIEKVLMWCAGIAALAGVACTVLVFIVPTPGMKRLAGYTAAGLGSAVVVCLFASWLLAYLIYVYIALALLGATGAVVYIRKLVLAAKAAARYGDAAEVTDPGDPVAIRALKAKHHQDQVDQGVAGVLEHLRGRAKIADGFLTKPLSKFLPRF